MAAEPPRKRLLELTAVSQGSASKARKLPLSVWTAEASSAPWLSSRTSMSLACLDKFAYEEQGKTHTPGDVWAAKPSEPVRSVRSSAASELGLAETKDLPRSREARPSTLPSSNIDQDSDARKEERQQSTNVTSGVTGEPATHPIWPYQAIAKEVSETTSRQAEEVKAEDDWLAALEM